MLSHGGIERQSNMQIVIGLLIGSLLAPGLLGLGFYLGYKNAKSKLPEIIPTVNVTFEKPGSPVISQRETELQNASNMAEFIRGL